MHSSARWKWVLKWTFLNLFNKTKPEFVQLLLVLGRLLDQQRQVLDRFRITRHFLVLRELFQATRHLNNSKKSKLIKKKAKNLLGKHGNVLVPILHPEVVVLVQQHFLVHGLGPTSFVTVHIVLDVQQVLGHCLQC